jgi:hypothetical protein
MAFGRRSLLALCRKRHGRHICTVGIYHILHDKDVHQKLFKTLKEAWPDKGTPASYETLEKLTYLVSFSLHFIVGHRARNHDNTFLFNIDEPVLFLLGYFLLGLLSFLAFRAVRDALPDNAVAQERILGASFLVLGFGDVSSTSSTTDIPSHLWLGFFTS